MKLSETQFNKLFYLIIIPLFCIIGLILDDSYIIIITALIFYYHIYSNYKNSMWPFDCMKKSIYIKKPHPFWTEFIAIGGSLILINTGINKIDLPNIFTSISSILIIIFGFIFGLAHFRQIYMRDNIYYKWIYENI